MCDLTPLTVCTALNVPETSSYNSGKFKGTIEKYNEVDNNYVARFEHAASSDLINMTWDELRRHIYDSYLFRENGKV